MSTKLKILAVSVLVIAGIGMKTTTAATSHAESPLTISDADALDLWIEKLAFKESSGRETIVVLDTNKKYSYGCLQFQEETFRRLAAKYDHHSTDIMDCAGQKQLAKQILRGDSRGWLHWKNSVLAIGRPPT